MNFCLFGVDMVQSTSGWRFHLGDDILWLGSPPSTALNGAFSTCCTTGASVTFYLFLAAKLRGKDRAVGCVARTRAPVRPKGTCFAAAALLAGALCVGFQAEVLAVPNPVLIPDHGNAADCGVMKFNGEYYLIGNSLAGDMFVSRDLVHWGNRTHVFSMHNNWTPGDTATDRNINACDPSYFNGVFHLYWSVDRGSLGVVQIGHAVSDQPLGPYHEPETNHWFASKIDAHLFCDDDGSFTFYSVKFGGGNEIWGQPALDPSTLTGEPRLLLTATPHSWELLDDRVNEGPFVFKYRGLYYMVYNANHTAKGHYAFGCAVAASPLAFTNSDKYPDPVVEKAFPAPGHRLTSPGQPTVISGPNGFEKWLVYFLEVDGARRQQAIDRVLFFDRRLYVDGPTSVASSGYHPVPSEPTVLDLFDGPDGSPLSSRWRPEGGEWATKDKTAEQNQADGRAFNLLETSKASQYLAEVNVKLLDGAGSEAGLIAYWKDSANWMSVTLDARNHTWDVRKTENSLESVMRTALPTNFNFQVWHAVRAQKNGSDFEISIDDRPAPGAAQPIATSFNGTGVPGLFTDSARAGFAGFIYTIGWDETGAAIRNWGAGINRAAQRGEWSVGSEGLAQSNTTGSARIFKGDAAEEYEFSAQLTQDVQPEKAGATMGMLPVYIDDQNYLQADIDLARGELWVGGRKAGESLEVQVAPLPKRWPVPTAEQSAQLWRYTMKEPRSQWAAVAFSDRGWKTGAAPFGASAARTVWQTNDLWLRRDFDLDQTLTGMARLWLRLQGEAEVYLNGVLALRGCGCADGYGSREVTEAARATLKQGKNTIAIHAISMTDTAPAIDAGLFLPGIVETPGSVNLRAVKLKDRVILFVNGRQCQEIVGSWPASQVGLTSDSMACHFSGLVQFRIH